MAVKIHSEILNGSSPKDIFFVHGNLASRHWWYPTIENLKTKWSGSSHKGRFILSDLRGFGDSSVPTDGDYSVDANVSDMIKLAEENNVRSALIVGHSAGGLLASVLIARRPDLFSSALLLDPVGTQGLVNVPADIKEKYQMMAADRALATQIIGLTIQGLNPEDTYFKNTIMNYGMQDIQRTGVSLVNALQNINFDKEISGIQKPVRILYGAKDWVLTEDAALSHKNLIAGSSYEKLPENGHCLLYENPQRMAQEIYQMLA